MGLRCLNTPDYPTEVYINSSETLASIFRSGYRYIVSVVHFSLSLSRGVETFLVPEASYFTKLPDESSCSLKAEFAPRME